MSDTNEHTKAEATNAERLRNRWEVGRFWLTFCAAVASAVAAWFSASGTNRTADFNAQNRVTSAMQNYLVAYTSMSAETQISFNCPEAFRGPPSEESNRALITAGLLVGVVDAMHQAADSRDEKWAGFLSNARGPITAPNSPLEAYASSSWTAERLQQARRVALETEASQGARQECLEWAKTHNPGAFP